MISAGGCGKPCQAFGRLVAAAAGTPGNWVAQLQYRVLGQGCSGSVLPVAVVADRTIAHRFLHLPSVIIATRKTNEKIMAVHNFVLCIHAG